MPDNIKRYNKILVANRGEIAIRVLRAISELHVKSVAIYTYEDRYSLHRYKADEAYQIGKEDDPLKPYLDIEEIISTAKKNGVDAIHPGYGFLSENVDFAQRCREENITFIGPAPEVMAQLGDKVSAKKVAIKAEVPIIRDNEKDLIDFDTVLEEAESIGFPVILKAAAGGGGRGMRVVRDKQDLSKAFSEAKGEAAKAFGNDTIFVEKYVENPKHIEVQIMADNHGSTVHLYERDCSVQRRFQKVVEVAPSFGLKEETREKLYDYALKIAKSVKYNNVGTVEFLVDAEENIYFIEVNPRIQVEHTITEEITGIDIVRAQILIASGRKLSDPQLFIKSQDDIKANGYAIQCRITTEDPINDFRPDYGKIIAYRSAGGFGIRLDAGNCYSGVTISPFFDSLLVKVSSSGRTLKGAAQRLHRALREFRIRGVKTNIGFLENVIDHQDFYAGKATVQFIEKNPDLLRTVKSFDRGTKTLKYLANVTVNGNPDVKFVNPTKKLRNPSVPEFDINAQHPKGTKDKLNELGREGFIDWLKNEKSVQFTDTTFRDAHQSLLATRFRTHDMLKVAEGFSKDHPQVFSMEVWGGATFDVCMRFLKESPWERLRSLREAIPNILLQMLLRGSNAVGYKAYPDNLIEKFIEKSAEEGIDVFRIFDSLNWVEAMKVSIKAVRERTNSLVEACICYTGEIKETDNNKYSLSYYLDLAKSLEDEGAHILAIKDMAGLLKPYSAELLVNELKSTVNIPIHLHSHDTSSIQAATYLKAIEAGVDVVDVAIASMSGLTSQPNFNSLVATLNYSDRKSDIDVNSLNEYSNYWEAVREYYYPFESGLKAGTAEVYSHEIPGGQYSNLRPQAIALGLEDQFETVKKNYALVNKMFGDLVKVTPSSKVVGDMAIYMTSNNLTEEDIFTRGDEISFPESVVSLFKGELGQPPEGFPEKLSSIILKGQKPFKDRPNAHLEPIDFDAEFAVFKEEFPGGDFLDFLSHQLYPKVYQDYYKHLEDFDEVKYLPTKAFFFGLQPGEEIMVEIARGKVIIIQLIYITKADEDGMKTVSFNLNGQTREIRVKDDSIKVERVSNRKAVAKNEIGSPLQGKISEIKISEGDRIETGQILFVIEAMKMETSVSAPFSGKVNSIVLGANSLVQQDDLVLEMEIEQ
ncbi:MAG: pyruvate carboxylase [Bacteroidota bacterium]